MRRSTNGGMRLVEPARVKSLIPADARRVGLVGAAVTDHPGLPEILRAQEQSLDWWRYFSFRTQSLRRTGSTAINMAWLAAGRFDAFYAFDNHVWDVAGAAVIVREAGGVLTNVDGSPYDPYTADALVSNGPLHPVLVEAMRHDPRQG